MNKYYILSVVCFCIVLFQGGCAEAYVPEIVIQASLQDSDLWEISDPELARVFFGTLTGFPHTYIIRAEKPFTLYTQIRVPLTDTSHTNVSGIIVKEQRRGRVEEIARFRAEDALWNRNDDELSNDTFLEGATFEKELGSGVYRIEVHTPDNREPYMLRVGKREDMTIGYVELVKRLVHIKDFYGSSRFGILMSPYIYWPSISVVSFCVVGWLLWKKKFFTRIKKQ